MGTRLPPVAAPPPCRRLDLPDAEVLHWPRAFDAAQADTLLARLRVETDWQQEHVTLFGVRRPVPRLVAWHGDPGTTYRYSGIVHEPRPWTDALLEVRAVAERLTGHAYDSVLLNLYRDGRDAMGWHADDERELGPEPAIASVSFGATRRFRLRHRRGLAATAVELAHGSLLSMAGPTQRHYVHAVPRTARAVGERVNLTFRRLLGRRVAGPPGVRPRRRS